MDKTTIVRTAVVLIVLLASTQLLLSYTAYSDSSEAELGEEILQQSRLPYEERSAIVPPRDGITVVAGHGFGNKSTEGLVAFAPDGRLLYFENEYPDYFDVDPSPEGDRTVLFVAREFIDARTCGLASRIPLSNPQCTVSEVVRVNLTTGEREVLFNHVAPTRINGGVHDVDRLDEDTLLVAGIAYDRVYIVNTSTDLIQWQWSAQHDFPLSGGGQYPFDWTHLNDVEALSDGWVMASLRNQDQVVFINKSEGLQEEWTLGAEDEHDIIYEQHNPDYIPEEDGGPAVLVADSQNNRIIEYQRKDGEWKESWIWKDDGLEWPRDADRLPDGHTLIADSNGDRVIEVNRSGAIVWQINLANYEVERLGTGDESADGPSATRADLATYVESEDEESESRSEGLKQRVIDLMPPKWVNALRFVTPGWVSLFELISITGIVASILGWFGFEVWRSGRVEIRSPIVIRDGSREESE